MPDLRVAEGRRAVDASSTRTCARTPPPEERPILIGFDLVGLVRRCVLHDTRYQRMGAPSVVSRSRVVAKTTAEPEVTKSIHEFDPSGPAAGCAPMCCAQKLPPPPHCSSRRSLLRCRPTWKILRIDAWFVGCSWRTGLRPRANMVFGAH